MSSLKFLGIGTNAIDVYRNMKRAFAGGCSLNASVFASMLGYPSGYLGILGSDMFGRFLMKILDQYKVDRTMCRVAYGLTSYSIIENLGGEREFMKFEHGVAKTNPIQLSSSDLLYMGEFDVIHTSYRVPFINEQLSLFPKFNNIIVYDFSNQKNLLKIKDIIKFIDIAVFSCSNMSEKCIKDFITNVHQIGAKFVLATMGSDGVLFSTGITITYCPSENVQVKDTCGAGDAFITAFVLSLCENGFTQSSCLSTKLILQSLFEATQFAIKICQLDGAFGEYMPCEKKI